MSFFLLTCIIFPQVSPDIIYMHLQGSNVLIKKYVYTIPLDLILMPKAVKGYPKVGKPFEP